MRSKIILALVVLNVLLLVSLCFRNVLTQTASAQAAGALRPSEYIFISGEVQGGTSGVVFMVDTRNNLLTARVLDNGGLTDMLPPIDLGRYFKTAR